MRNATAIEPTEERERLEFFEKKIRPVLVEHCYRCHSGEAPELRAARLRQFEDFVNPGGYATPDDVTLFGDCQTGFGSTGFDYLQGYSRGLAEAKRGPDETARAAGLEPLTSVAGLSAQNTELGTHAPLREWARLMRAGIEGRKAYE